jgi:hypothetical protein
MPEKTSYQDDMLKHLLHFLRVGPCLAMPLDQNDAWQHPALLRMSQRELADLPFPRGTDIDSARDPGALSQGRDKKDDGTP